MILSSIKSSGILCTRGRWNSNKWQVILGDELPGMHTSMHMYAYVYYHNITSGMYDITKFNGQDATIVSYLN